MRCNHCGTDFSWESPIKMVRGVEDSDPEVINVMDSSRYQLRQEGKSVAAIHELVNGMAVELLNQMKPGILYGPPIIETAEEEGRLFLRIKREVIMVYRNGTWVRPHA
jgi:hypothetical protein